MRKLFLYMALSTLSFSTFAQTTNDVDTVTISKPQPRIEIPARTYRMTPYEFDQFRGVYELSNGQTLSLFQRGNAQYAQVSDQESHKIVATADNAFVALDKQLQMRIDIKDNGDVTGELLMVVPTKNLVGGKASKEQILVASFR
jgi:hypothetical protein